MFFGDPWATIDHLKVNHLSSDLSVLNLFDARFHSDFPSVITIIHRVFDEVGEDLLKCICENTTVPEAARAPLEEICTDSIEKKLYTEASRKLQDMGDSYADDYLTDVVSNKTAAFIEKTLHESPDSPFFAIAAVPSCHAARLVPLSPPQWVVRRWKCLSP